MSKCTVTLRSVNANGDKFWHKDGKLHRDDGPAIEYASGTNYWYKNGKRHRDGGPAVIVNNGGEYWYKNDRLHRDDGPAIDCVNGEKHWFKDGKRHRDSGPAIEYTNGTKCWYKYDIKGVTIYLNKGDTAVLKSDILEMFETLLDIIYGKTDYQHTWETATECTTIGEVTDRARALLKEIRQEKG